MKLKFSFLAPRFKFALWLLLMPLSPALAGSLNVDGDLTVKDKLTVTGTSIGMTGTDGLQGVSALYTDGTTSLFSLTSTRPSHQWLWAHATSGATIPMMTLDSGHVLTIYDTSGNPAIVLNPSNQSGPTALLTQQAADSRYVVSGGTNVTLLSNTTISGSATINGGLAISGTATMNGSDLLTQNAANALFLSATAGLSASNGKVGIGVSNPAAKLDVRQSLGGLAPASLASFYGNGGSSDLASKVTIQSNSNSSGQVQIGGSGKEVSLAYISGVTAFGSPAVSNLGNTGVVNQGLGLYLDTGDIYSIGSDAAGGPIFRIKSSGYGSIGGVVDTNYKWSVYGSEHVSGTAIVDGKVGVGTTNPQAALDVNGSANIAGALAISSTGSLKLPDGTVLSSYNTLKSVMTSGTAVTISGTIPASQVSGLSPVATSGTAAFAQASATAAALSGTIAAAQVNGLAPVATGGDLDYSKLTHKPTNVLAFDNDAGYIGTSGTGSNLTLSGTTKISGGMIVTGTAVQVVSGATTKTKIVASGTNRLVLIPEQGDLSMGDFTNGSQPQ